MTRLSWCLTTSVDGELRTIFPGAIEPDDLATIEPVIRRAVERRLRTEAAARAGGEPEPRRAPTRHEPPRLDAIMTQGEMARTQGYSGDPCSKCGGWRMKQAGHCLVCDDCGETTGCS